MKLIAAALICCVVVATAANTALRAVRPAVFAMPPVLVDAAADAKVNVVFFGSSRVQDGFIPDVFDQVLEQAGTGDFHSYNLGLPDAVMAEIRDHVDRLFALNPPGIRLVLFEPNLAGRKFIWEPNTLRSINYFSIWNAYYTTQMINAPLRERMGLTRLTYPGHMLAALLRHYFSIGLAWAQPQFSSPEPGEPTRGFSGSDGVLAADDTYRAQLHRVSTDIPNPELISEGQLSLVLSIAADIKAHGAVPIIVTTPQFGHFDFTTGLIAKFAQRCAGKGPLVFDFISPIDYPQLWDPRNRQNYDHLNASGAAIYSRLIAERLAAAIKDNSIALPLCSG